MNAEQARAVIERVLSRIAPEVDLLAVDPTESLTDQLAINSMDQLNLVLGVHEETGVDIPERDYPKLASVEGFVTYLVARGA